MTDNTQGLNETPDELDMFIATHTRVSDDTDDGVYREAEYHALKKALANLVNKQIEKAVSADEFLNYLFRNGHVDREWDAEELEGTLNKLKESK